MDKTIFYPSIEEINRMIRAGDFCKSFAQENQEINTDSLQWNWAFGEFSCFVQGWEIVNERKETNKLYCESKVLLGDSFQSNEHNRREFYTLHYPPIPLKSLVFIKSLQYKVLFQPYLMSRLLVEFYPLFSPIDHKIIELLKGE